MTTDYDILIGIGFSIAFAIAYFMVDDNNSGLVIFAFLNIGLAVMVYAGVVELWMLILSVIFTIFLIFLAKRGNSV